MSASKVSRECAARCVLPGKLLTDSFIEQTITIEITFSFFRRVWISAHGICSERVSFCEYDELSSGRGLTVFDQEFGSYDT